MKKIILLALVALSISSCSSDSDGDSANPPSNYLTVTINGVTKTFNTFEVIEDSDPSEGGNTMELSASIDNYHPIRLTFKFPKNEIGEDVLYDLTWYNDGINKGISQTTSNFTVNTPTHLEGTFSAIRTETNGVVSEVFENGSFSINY